MTTKQKFARGAGIGAAVLTILGAALAAGYNISISKPASASETSDFDPSLFITREEFNESRRNDRIEYLATVKELRDDMREVRADVSSINDHLINMSRTERVKSETVRQ